MKKGTKEFKKRQKKYSDKHYKENREQKIKQVKENNKRYKARNKQYVYDFLKNNPCICGESDPVVLEFNHIDPKNKKNLIANLANNPGSLNKLKEEISKCEVLCANCHRRKTAIQFGWYNNVNK